MSNRLLHKPRLALGSRAPVWPFGLDEASLLAPNLGLFLPLARDIGAKDLSPRGNHAAINGAPVWTATEFGAWSLAFDGTDDYLAVPHHASLDVPANQGFVVAVVVKFAGTNSTQAIYRTAGTSNTVPRIVLERRSGGNIKFEVHDSGGQRETVDTSGDLNDGEWHWVCAGRHADGTTEVWIDGASAGTSPGTITDALDTAEPHHIAARHDANERFEGEILQVQYNPGLAPSDALARYAHAPETRWDLTREDDVPRIWPKAGGAAATQTSIASLQAALQRQASHSTSADAALRAEAVLSAVADAVLERAVSRSASLDLAVQAVRSAQADLDAALKASLELEAGLDANLTSAGPSERAAALDGAILRLEVVSGALEAALRASADGTAALDAWIALGLERIAGLDAAAEIGRQLPETALQAAIGARPARIAALDAVVGLLVAAAGSRTHTVAARAGHTVAGDDRRSAIPSGKRRH